MEKEIDIFGNLLMTMNWIMDGKINRGIFFGIWRIITF